MCHSLFSSPPFPVASLLSIPTYLAWLSFHFSARFLLLSLKVNKAKVHAPKWIWPSLWLGRVPVQLNDTTLLLLFNLSGLLWALLVLVVPFLFLDHSCEKDATRGLIYRKVVQSSVTSPDMYVYLWISLVVSFLHIKRWFSGLCIYERERERNCDLHGGLWAVKASREEGREHCLGWKRPCRAKGQCTESKQGISATAPVTFIIRACLDLSYSYYVPKPSKSCNFYFADYNCYLSLIHIFLNERFASNSLIFCCLLLCHCLGCSGLFHFGL